MATDLVKTLGESVDQSKDASFESPFGDFGRPYKVVEAKDPGYAPVKVNKWKYTFCHDVFTIYKPWDECPVCLENFKSGETELPAKGDIVCPHTRRIEYLNIMQNFLHAGWKQLSYHQEVLKNGTVQISLSWAIPDKEKESIKPPTRF